MRKTVAILVAFIMLFASIPFNVFASESESSGYNDLVAKASMAFPEYADRIHHSGSKLLKHSGSSAPRKMIVCETRKISDNEHITYTEYSDGIILLSDSNCTVDTSTVEYETSPSYRNITIDIHAACVTETGRDGYCEVKGVKYTLVSGGYDYIRDRGQIVKGRSCLDATYSEYTLNEHATGYAVSTYNCSFKVSLDGHFVITTRIVLNVGDDSADVQHFVI